MADIIRVQPAIGIQPVQNQTYKVQASDQAKDQRRHHEEHEAPHDTIELHEEVVEQEAEVSSQTTAYPDPPQDHGLDIAV